MNNSLRKLIAQNLLRSSRRSSSEVHYKRPTMDDLPVPQGSWQDHYDKKQAKYNLQLLFGSLFFAGTVAVCYNTLDFNAYTPMYPAGHPKEEK